MILKIELKVYEKYWRTLQLSNGHGQKKIMNIWTVHQICFHILFLFHSVGYFVDAISLHSKVYIWLNYIVLHSRLKYFRSLLYMCVYMYGCLYVYEYARPCVYMHICIVCICLLVWAINPYIFFRLCVCECVWIYTYINSLKPQHTNPNPNPLANQLWSIDFLTPPTPLIIPHRFPAFLESLMPLKNWCLINARWSKNSLKHSIRFCGIFSKFKTEFYCISFF